MFELIVRKNWEGSEYSLGILVDGWSSEDDVVIYNDNEDESMIESRSGESLGRGCPSLGLMR